MALLGTKRHGKSTLMKCVMGMVRPTEKGSVFLTIDNQRHDLEALHRGHHRLGVAMVPEGSGSFPS